MKLLDDMFALLTKHALDRDDDTPVAKYCHECRGRIDGYGKPDGHSPGCAFEVITTKFAAHKAREKRRAKANRAARRRSTA